MIDEFSLGVQRGGLIIRLLEHGDLEAARQLHNDETTLLQLSNPFPVSIKQQDLWYETMSLSQTSRRYSIIEADTGAFVGLFRVDQMDLINRSVCIGLDIVQARRGRGYARSVYEYFIDFFFNTVGMNRLFLVTIDSNKAARNLYISLGMQDEGRHREAIWRNGEYVDLIQMSLLRSDYLASVEPYS